MAMWAGSKGGIEELDLASANGLNWRDQGNDRKPSGRSTARKALFIWDLWLREGRAVEVADAQRKENDE